MSAKFLFTTSLVALAMATGAAAQTTPSSTSVEGVVVTGSRIRTLEFSSPSPITVLEPEQAQLEGQPDIAAFLQQLPAANNNVQINNFFTGFIVTGGPGVNTLSLRGLGAQRTLFLINGQRLGPAGVGGTVGPVDLNTLNFPLAEISDIQVLKDGASSVYGSDAIGGVVNIITKTNYNGGDIRAFYGPSEHGGANRYELDASYGKTWSRGYVNAGFSFYQQNELKIGSRPYLACATDNATFVDGGGVADLIDPLTGKPKCQNTFAPAVAALALDLPGNPQFDYRANPNAVLGGGPTGDDLPGFEAVGLRICTDRNIIFRDNHNSCAPSTIDIAASRVSRGLIPTDFPHFRSTDAISPDRRYMLNIFGGYDLTPHVQLYGSLILTERLSSQFLVDQFFTVVNPFNAFSPFLASNNHFFLPIPIVPQDAFSSQKVDYGRAVLGVKGDFPDLGFFHKWTWDLYAQFSQSHGYYTENFALADRVNATAGSTNAAGCDPTANINGGPTMADLEPGVACVPVDFFSAVARGAFTPAEKAFLYKTEQGTTIYNHYYVEGAASGELFNLPGGPIGASVGFQLRREELDDRPPADVQIGNDYNLTSAGRTKGADSIQEVFGEVRLPLFKDLPLVQSLVFSASGRFSHYKSYGSTGTYKIGLDWAITPWLAIRASQGTGFRAPALYELFLADQSGFLDQITIDPCINYGGGGVSQNVQKNCASQGIAADYGGGAQSALILTGGGIHNLKAETSLSRTIGVVFQPKWFGIDLRLAADYYTFDIENQIQEFGAANIVFQCYNSPNFPNDPFCSLFTRDLNPASPTFQAITVVHDNFVNVAKQVDQGLDVTARWRQRLPYDSQLTVDANLSWTFYTNTILLNGSVNNFLGQVGQPPFVGTVNFRLDKGPWTLNYFLNMVGHTSDDRFVSAVDPNYNGLHQAVRFDHQGPFYTTSNIALRRKFGDWSAEFGVQNLFDKSPPPYGAEGFQNRIGVVPLISQYDLIGRSFFIDVERHF